MRGARGSRSSSSRSELLQMVVSMELVGTTEVAMFCF